MTMVPKLSDRSTPLDRARGVPNAHPSSGAVPTTAAPVVARDLAVQYGTVHALGGVSLQIEANRITALIGPSGCGKTSFLNSLNRMTDLIPGCAVTGSVHLHGRNILAPAVDVVALRRRVGMIFQRPTPFPMSIARNMELALREHGVHERHRLDETIETALRDVGLWSEVKDRLGTSALDLSGGQQQRLCIARALALRPEILLLDEPCSSLDPLASGVVEDLIVSLRGRYTLVVVTHNLAQARRIADDVAVFWVQDGSGRLIEHGAAERIFDAPRDPVTQAYVNGMRG